MLNHYAQEPGRAGGTRHFSIARNLPDFGWTVSIIAASVELNTGRQRLAGKQRSAMTMIDNVRFVWLRTPKYKGNGFGRLYNMLLYTVRALLLSPSDDLPRPDIVVGSSVHPFAAWAGAKIAKRYGVPFIFEVRDLWPQTLIDLGRLRERSLATRALRHLEKKLYVLAARIVVLLPRATEYIEPLGIAADKIHWIPNGVDVGDSRPTLNKKQDGRFTFMYFGAHGTANGLDNVLRAMKLIEQDSSVPPMELRLIGGGPAKPELQKLADSLGLSRVAFEDPVAKSDIPGLASQADAFVFNLVDAPVFKYGISSNKLFDFFAAARPIVFCCDAANNPVAEAGAGPTVQPGDSSALAQAMVNIARTPLEERNSMGLAGFEYVKQRHDYRYLSERFAEVLNDAMLAQESYETKH